MRYLIIILFVFSALWGKSQYTPISENKNIVNYHAFSISYIPFHKQAEWVYYKLNKEDLTKNCKRTNRFCKDKKLEWNQASLRDYKKSGYDRGHLKPAGDCTSNKLDMKESFYLTNMSPQAPQFNRGIWKKLEDKFRKFAVKYDSLYIVTGPVLEENLQTIGNHVSIPKMYYKIAYFPQLKKMIAYLLPNRKIKENLSNYVCSVDKIEQITKIDFFSQLEDNLENDLEKKVEHL